MTEQTVPLRNRMLFSFKHVHNFSKLEFQNPQVNKVFHLPIPDLPRQNSGPSSGDMINFMP